MTQTTGRFFDEIGRLVTDAAGAASGLAREVETLVKSQFEKLVNGMDLVKREEFEVVREMAQLAREQNEQLSARLAALEAAKVRDNSTGDAP